MSSRTSSRSTLTMVPSTMSPSLKYLMVLSMAARKSSAEPMSLTATCGEVTEGLGMWWVAPDRFGRRDLGRSNYWPRRAGTEIVLRTRSRDRKTTDGYRSRLLDCVQAGQTRSREQVDHDQAQSHDPGRMIMPVPVSKQALVQLSRRQSR